LDVAETEGGDSIGDAVGNAGAVSIILRGGCEDQHFEVDEEPPENCWFRLEGGRGRASMVGMARRSDY
jgi:hypothetical protein